MTIECSRDFNHLKIYINRLLHLHIVVNQFMGLYAYMEGNNKLMYYIEIKSRDNATLTLEYDKIEVWEKVLVLIDKNI